MNEQRFPKGWEEQRVKRLIAELDARTDEEWFAADEAAAADGGDQAVITVPAALLPEIRRSLASHKTAEPRAACFCFHFLARSLQRRNQHAAQALAPRQGALPLFWPPLPSFLPAAVRAQRTSRAYDSNCPALSKR